jgi:hypothetical protein
MFKRLRGVRKTSESKLPAMTKTISKTKAVWLRNGSDQ